MRVENNLFFSMSMEIGLVFLIVKMDSISVWGIELDLISLKG